ncbi:hypothetical protein [Cellvibrio sp. KY-GH-1]|uniref:hypothetical protein n=1 Tax=Cellvibrio sp. KY-GH-1 TaxID=2303332 RepID=UPI001CDA0148|nr:hypothetical protein [Cellvibrio sp. KY-GH-1]
MSDQLHRKLSINQALLSSKCAGVLVTNITLYILVWRKVYKSNLLKDPIAGFAKLSDTYIHHKLINGEYKNNPPSKVLSKVG